MRKHRSYVGPGASYDLIAAMTFNLLTSYGLREKHKVLDIGCGSLRVGRLLIQYLNGGNYVGIEPNGWLVDDAIAYEIGQDILYLKQPVMVTYNATNDDAFANYFDYAFAQSIFTHCDLKVVDIWFEGVKRTMKPDGHFFFTYWNGGSGANTISGFDIKKVAKYPLERFEELAEKLDFKIEEIDLKHPAKQQWVLMRHK